jgi:hypothetical protein
VLNTYPQELSTESPSLWDSLKATLIYCLSLTQPLRFTLAGEPLRAASKRRLIAVGALYVLSITSLDSVNANTKTHPEIAILKIYTHQRLGDLKQLNCIDKLWMRESRWSSKAKNKKSTAFGIPQILGLKTKDPYRQIERGLDYIRYRYGTPCEAWKFWKVAIPHHY